MAHVPRIYRPGRIAPGPLTLDGEPAKRLGAVLRVRPGEPFLVFAGDGREWHATVSSVERNSIRADVTGVARQEGVPALTLEVWCALVRANRFETVIEKCTEAGADVIRPLTSDFTARADAASPARIERWNRIVVEASEQSGRLHLPVIAEAAPFERVLSNGHHPVVLADPEGLPWPDVARLLPVAGTVAVAVGPEGGWSDAERAAARSRGALVARTGDTILRTETAAIVMTGLVRARA